MIVLHTADWHLGKRLGRFDRYAEFDRFADELIQICQSHGVDLVLIAGDIFDAPNPSNRALRTFIRLMQRITATGAKVVAIAGNHDSAEHFENLNDFSELHGVYLKGRIRSPGNGGVFRLSTRAGDAAIAAMPYLRENQVVDFLSSSARRYGAYKERLGEIIAGLDEELASQIDCVRLFMGHLAIDGALAAARSGFDGARGERVLTIGRTYVIDARQLPQVAQYSALGHIHAANPIRGPAPTRYSGSPLALDFGERNDRKQVVIVDVEPGSEARVQPIDLATPTKRSLRVASGNWEDLSELTERFGDDFLALTVEIDAPDPALFQQALEVFPNLVRLRQETDRREPSATELSLDEDWTELYRRYVREASGQAPAEHLLAEFRSIYAAVTDAPA